MTPGHSLQDCKSFSWALRDQNGHTISLWTSLNHVYIPPPPPSHSHSMSFAYSQNSESGKGSRCWRGGWRRRDLCSGPSGSPCLEVRDNNRKNCVLWCWGKKSVPDAGEESVQEISKGQEKTATVFPGYGHFSIKIFFEIILDWEKISKAVHKAWGSLVVS